MTNVYTESDYENALKLKRRLFYIYLAIIGVGLVACVTFFIFFLELPYLSTPELTAKKNLYLALVCVITGVEIIFSFVYLGIPYKRAKYYFRLLEDVKTGQKIMNESTFLQNEGYINEVGNVDFHDKEKPMPNLKNGDIIKYVTYSNVLLSYGLKSEEDVFEEMPNK